MKRFNVEEFIWFITLLGFTIFFYYLIWTGKISIFISPRMGKYMIFSFIGFSILSLYQSTKIFTIPNRKPINKSCLILLATLIIGFAAAQKGLNLNIADKKGFNMTSNITPKVVNEVSKETVDEPIQEEEKVESEGAIVFNEATYLSQLVEIGDDVEKFKGKKVVISGFVYKNNELKNDQFVIARMAMTCCSADAQVLGIISKWPNAGTLEKEVWVRVEGTIDSTVLKDEDFKLPMIIVDKVEKIQKPENIYIYP